MAHNAAAAASSSSPSAAQMPSNGIDMANPTSTNRKRQKRRAKEAARKAAQEHTSPTSPSPSRSSSPHPDLRSTQVDNHPELYSDDEDDDYPYPAATHANPPLPLTHPNHHFDPASQSSPAAKRKGKKKRSSLSAQQYPIHPAALATSAIGQMPLPNPPSPPPMSSATLHSVRRGAKQDRIWNTSTQEERERIKEFWLSLSEEERKSLLKIEKEAVLRKMKEQQKHSCSCTVCGRKRTAIEEELEVLYDAYYEELEQYAHTKGDPAEGMLPPLRNLPPRRTSPHLPAPPLPLNHNAHPHHRTSRVHEIIDDDEEDDLSDVDDDEEDDDEYSDDEEDLYSDDDPEPDLHLARGIGADFFNFGNSLTVKGGILTVADDLLKNDGKKFIEMMEQLAERRMQREQEAEFASQQPTHYQPNGHDPPLEEDEYDDDEEEYDSQEEYDDEEEEDEMGGMTEEQRMEEGRRMFQIFAARMFEQRVLTAYREKVAAERQKRLLEELEDETRLDAEREAKKARDAEKRKKKKDAQKQAKAEEKARRDAEKAAEEAAQREIEEKKREEVQRRKEEQRKKKEAERKALEEEKQRKEAERIKRQQEERERHQEAERKLREQKALEKKTKDEARKKEREDREAREREAKEKRIQDEREKREREAKAKADREAAEREKRMQQHIHPPQIAKRPSQLGMVAVPPGLHPKQQLQQQQQQPQPQQSSSGVNSPHVSIATPALPKSTAPGMPRQPSLYGSHATSPRSSQPSTSKSTSPGNAPGSAPHSASKTILQKPPGQPPVHHPQPPAAMNHMGPSAMYPNGSNTFNGLPQVGGFSAYQQPHGHFMGHRPSGPAFPGSGQIGGSFQPVPAPNGMYGVPPGMNGLGMMPQGRGFPMDNTAAFSHQQMQPVGAPGGPPGFGPPHNSISNHARTQSSDKNIVEPVNPAPAAHPISRPNPIQRPSSVKPHEGRLANGDVDDLSNHLGSSALLDDADDPLPPAPERRQSAFAGPRAGGPLGMSSPFAGPARLDSFGTPGSSWTSPSMFGPPGSSLTAGSNWGAGLSSPSWPHNGFGNLGHRPSGPNRPLTIRLALCQACKQLSQREPSADDFHPVESILRQIDLSRPPVDSPVTLKEIEDICETEGDAQNGGGLLHVRREGNTFAVRFEPDAGTPGTGRAPGALGEIGSPMPSHSVPFGTSAPNRMSGFGSLSGAVVGSPSGNGFH